MINLIIGLKYNKHFRKLTKFRKLRNLQSLEDRGANTPPLPISAFNNSSFRRPICTSPNNKESCKLY